MREPCLAQVSVDENVGDAWFLALRISFLLRMSSDQSERACLGISCIEISQRAQVVDSGNTSRVPLIDIHSSTHAGALSPDQETLYGTIIKGTSFSHPR